MLPTDVLLRKYEKNYPINEVIFEEGELSTEMYFILEGEVRIVKKIQDVVQDLGHIGKGQFFGEMSTFTGKARVATAIAVTDCKLICVDPSTFEGLIESNSHYGLTIAKTLCERLSHADEQIEELIIKNQMDQVVSILYHETSLMDQKKKPYDYRMISSKIHEETGFSKEIIYNILSHLQDEKKIRISKINDDLYIEILEALERRKK